MKTKINIYGSGWNEHEAAEVSAGLKNIEWVLDGSGVANFYPNNMTSLVLSDRTSLPKFAWLNESTEIDTTSHSNILNVMDEFDLVFTHKKSFYAVSSNARFVPASCLWIKDPSLHKKSKLVSMITSSKTMTSGHRYRIEWAEKLKGSVDLYGHYSNPIERKEQGLVDYMFSVAMENASYKSYFTEKILDCFATGTIPIYWGTPDIDLFFNQDGIIKLEENFDVSMLNEDYYHDRIDAIKENLDRVLEYRSVEDYMYEHYLVEIL